MSETPKHDQNDEPLEIVEGQTSVDGELTEEQLAQEIKAEKQDYLEFIQSQNLTDYQKQKLTRLQLLGLETIDPYLYHPLFGLSDDVEYELRRTFIESHPRSSILDDKQPELLLPFLTHSYEEFEDQKELEIASAKPVEFVEYQDLVWDLTSSIDQVDAENIDPLGSIKRINHRVIGWQEKFRLKLLQRYYDRQRTEPQFDYVSEMSDENRLEHQREIEKPFESRSLLFLPQYGKFLTREFEVARTRISPWFPFNKSMVYSAFWGIVAFAWYRYLYEKPRKKVYTDYYTALYGPRK
eukprot:TRINITY_DN2244_c0_g1_i1.p1 TRINITY_DN2244_c0_g1~~TRINITY_DN2244_c0_g1_i1.p1  ORF type:complete len:296 (+),score=47.60 TRINITY_DN2244_c0_g1_i1:72-959(+)